MKLSLGNRGRLRGCYRAGLLCLFMAFVASRLLAQVDATERAFPQSKPTIEKTLKTMQVALAGRLPTLEGFADSERPLDRYQRGYYQATVLISPGASGGSVVRVSVKVTAWYSDPAGSHSGYQLLNSNGRLESDVLDQLGEQLAKVASPSASPTASLVEENADSETRLEKKLGVAASASTPAPPLKRSAAATVSAAPAPIVTPPASAATPTAATSTASSDSVTSTLPTSAASGPRTAPTTRTQPNNNPSSPFNKTLAAQDHAIPHPLADAATLKTDSQLETEIEGLEEILKSQSHPKNLVAVKKSGTAVVAKPSLSAKPLFLADAHDEFEMLDFNRDWVHIRISGLSRGWIWRNSLEMPEGISDTTSESGPAPATPADLFHVSREETGAFPGDWQPLRGKNVKILSVTKIDEAHPNSDPQDKLEYAKLLLDKSYAELRNKPQDVAGIVLVFDSADGGMIAATLATLQQWKTGTMSDAALWHNCFFDPPETFNSASSSGTQ